MEKPLRLLVEPGTYTCRNIGDVAMLRILVKRINQLLPDSSLYVVTKDPELLNTYCPYVLPVDATARNKWLYSRLFFARLYHSSFAFAKYARHLDSSLKRNHAHLAHQMLKFKLSRQHQQTDDVEGYFNLVCSVDALLFTGMGAFNDEFKGLTLAWLDLIGVAQKLRKPVLMFGQGLGPISDPELLHRAKQVFPSIWFFALREKLTSLPLLRQLGVQDKRIVITGDDAIEDAYRDIPLGNALGINLRIAEYSGVDRDDLETLRTVLQKITNYHQTELLPIPISHNADQYDPGAIYQLIKGLSYSDGGATIDTPEQLMNQVARCRVVITGSYHAGVFALSQGIPVVGIAKSHYYRAKFDGLAEQFQVGCSVIWFDEVSTLLESTVRHLWEDAVRLKPIVLQSARQQIEQSQLAYSMACDLIRLVATK